MADRFLGIAAPQPVLAVRRGDDDATKATWFRRQMAQAASYRARLVGPTESPEWRRGTAVLWPSVRIASSGRSQGPRCSTRAKTEATGSGEMVGQQTVATAEATRTMCPPGDLQRGESSR